MDDRNVNRPIVPGVYRIKCRANGKEYIGGSGDVQNRIAGHKSRLRGGSHPLKAMQDDFAHYGEAVFAFEICELFLSRKEAIRREEELLAQSTGLSLYNTILDRKTYQEPVDATDALAMLACHRLLVEKAIEHVGGICRLARATGIMRSTLQRCLNGQTKTLQPMTIAKLIKAGSR
jgi:predicted GIY-YIG superfamily endonuclease